MAIKQSKAAPAKETSTARWGVKDGIAVSVAGGAMRISSKPSQPKSGRASNWSPLTEVVRQIKENPSLGRKAATKAGITTKTGQLAKAYKR
ncbi:hypothetical protein [Candidimonas nitroreducens]|uniref:hypothetical protein n=1 Tax=Candidimonas nitroreducens TaxID=683354 RepID=UPI0011789281|nr:hypothetical protein [Candidimonas nitroreducens]